MNASTSDLLGELERLREENARLRALLEANGIEILDVPSDAEI